MRNSVDGYQCDVLCYTDGLSITDDQVMSSLMQKMIYRLFKIMTKWLIQYIISIYGRERVKRVIKERRKAQMALQ